MEDAHCRAPDAAERLKKKAEHRSIEASIKIGSQKPLLWTLEDSIDLAIVEERVQDLQKSLKGRCPPYMRVAVAATFDLVEGPETIAENSSTAHERAHSQTNTAPPTKKQRETASTRQKAVEMKLNKTVTNHIAAISRLHTCERSSCRGFDQICYNLPVHDHVMLNSGHLREWNQGIKDDVGVSINHPPPSLDLRMAREK